MTINHWCSKASFGLPHYARYCPHRARLYLVSSGGFFAVLDILSWVAVLGYNYNLIGGDPLFDGLTGWLDGLEGLARFSPFIYPTMIG